METVINLGIPHIGEQIFESIDTSGLINCLEVSETWKILAENVLIKRWINNMIKACALGKTKVVQLLLERCNPEEIGLNIKDKYGRTPFMWACIMGHKDVVELLLDHSERIDLNARNTFGSTAIMCACWNGHKNIVKLLLNMNNSDQNVDLKAGINKVETDLMFATQNYAQRCF